MVAPLLALAFLLPSQAAPQAAPPEPPPDLQDVFAPGFLVEDGNGDGHADRVTALLVLPRNPGTAAAAAAANLAARLAFESYGFDPELLRSDDPAAGREGRSLVVVGRAESLLGAAGADPARALADLTPGEGSVTRLPPSDALPAGGLWVAGADATGLLAATDYLAGRYPGVWAPDGATWVELARGIRGRAEEGSGDEVLPGPFAVTAALDRAVLAAGRAGVVRISATVRVEAPEHWDLVRENLDPEGSVRELLPPGLHRLDLRLLGPDGREAVLRVSPERPWDEEPLSAWEPGSVPDFTLSDLFSTRGIYRDTSRDLLPDRIEAWISLRGAAAAPEVAEVAARIAHEATGLRLPLARPAGEEDPPEERGFPILVGLEHFTTERLRQEERLGAPTGVPGEGFVELVPEALGEERHALAVSGTDVQGLAAAARLLARRLPYLHRYGKGAYGLRDVEEEVRRFFQARGAAGQTALALVKLDAWLDRLEAGERPGIPPSDQAAPWDPEGPGWRPDTPLRGLRVELVVDTVPAGLEEWISARVRERLPGVSVEVELHPGAFGAGAEILSMERHFGWEVDDAWEALRSQVLPRIGPGSRGRIELRVSEPPELRRELATALRDSVAARGGDPAGVDVVVLSAYKQGFSWIQDEVVPRLRSRAEAEGRAPARVEIDYRHLLDDDGVRWQVVGSDTRWLQELFPVEEILARQLGIADSAVVFRGIPGAERTYRLRALDREGAPILEEAFDARYVVQPYFTLHPEYEGVRVTTGWLRAELDGETVADRRIETDLERFWSFWQDEVQPALRDYVMDLHEGRVTPASAPFFDELRIEARLSEPNHRIGVDEEVISSLESLHNDLYFTTLAFLSHLGQHYGVGALNFPGRILPFIDPGGAGENGWARVTLTGRSRASAELVLRVETAEGAARWRYPLEPLPTEAPKLRGIAVQAGERTGEATPDPGSAPPADRLRRLLFDVVAVDSLSRFHEHRDRAPEGAVDRAFLSVEMLEGMVEAARDLHAAGVLEGALAFQGVDELAFRFRVERADDFRRTAVLPASARPTPTERPVLLAPDFRHDPSAGPLVQWDTPIPPPENDSILARLATFPEAEVYHVGRSFLGKDLWAVDLLPPTESAYRSRHRLTALRPTIFLSGRQHANEVSSTSHLLRLGELLVTDPAHRDLLRRVNVVLNPILNADGAQLAYDLQLVNPDFTLHAGYLGALGVDVTAGSGSDPLYPESTVRPGILAAWLPDVFLNLHGYPSHEWVQHFSGYAAWVRGRTVVQRTWWAPRGWFIPGFTWVDDPEHPEIREAQFAILDTLAQAITSLPEVEAMNRRQYARYARYGRQDVEGFRETFHHGMLAYLSLRGREATGEGPENPRILTFAATTEAPDETARGDWLHLVATAGLAHTSALIRYLAAGDPRVERTATAYREDVTRTVSRKRPVLPVGEEEEPDP
jgi:hypothetical protein